ncbi:putative GHMP kinase [Candidatus Nitrososphaera gargensis Ga9.2]|uniref:Pantoate kinase n=1 Tax=Nitrososphaera gargensis (strain Ga9.2) TaxID=1237085 RepID=K0IGS5_NITGG|nr:putative GHMP kinase [Candidatus Nitrososphaera gargensis Ga9.2]
MAKAFSPGHITGFFEIPYGSYSHFLHKGSKGAGFSIDRGISTTAYVYESATTDYQISINGVRSSNVDVSKWVVEEYLKLADRPYFVNVEHDIGIPVGFGLGSSGAAALSLSYALNEALDASLSRTQAAQIAHHAEIACKTGLGTVIAEFAGGFEMRTGAGAPGVGSVVKIDLENYYKAVVLCLAPISTKSFLTNMMDEINGLGGVMLSKLSKSRSVDEFLRMSHEFAETLGLTEGKCKEPIAALKALGIESSVALFGQTVFTLVPQTRSKQARDALKGFGGTLLVCNVDSNGARVL